MKAAIYARVSTEHQDYTAQIESLRAYAASNKWDVAEYFEKESAKAGNNRPELTRLLADAREKKFETVLVWKVDRFGRSLREFIDNVLKLDDSGVRFVAVAGGIDTDKRNPFSKLLMNLLAMFAEFELDMIHERTQTGYRRYRDAFARGCVGKGKARESISKKNLRVGRPKLIFDRARALELQQQGMTLRAIGKTLNVNWNTVRVALNKPAAA